MSFADANRASIRVVEESVWGTTPASGNTREIRLTSSSLAANKETAISDELRSDRMVSDMSEVAASSGGDINFEFSAGAQDEFIAAILMGAWTRPMERDFFKGVNVAVASTSTFTVSGGDYTDYFVVGRRVRLAGFTDPANSTYHEIQGVAHSGGVTTVTITDTDLVVEAGSATTAVFDANDVVVMSDTTIQATANGFSSTGTPFATARAAGQLVPGQKIHVSGLTGAEGYFTIVTVADDEITTNPVPGSVVSAGDPVTVKGSLLRNPSDVANIIQRMFTIETAFYDINQYQIQTGMVPGSMSLEVSTGAIINGTIGFQGRETSMSGTETLTTGGYNVLDTVPGEVVNATTNIGSLTKNGLDLASAIQSLSLTVEGNLRTQSAIGSKFARGIGAGRLNITGSMSVYFEDAALFTDFLNHSTVSLSFTITDADGQVYIITIPALKIAQNQISPEGIDQDVMETIEFTAIRDPDTDCQIQIDRFSPA